MERGAGVKEEFKGISPEITDNAKKVLEKRYLKKVAKYIELKEVGRLRLSR